MTGRLRRFWCSFILWMSSGGEYHGLGWFDGRVFIWVLRGNQLDGMYILKGRSHDFMEVLCWLSRSLFFGGYTILAVVLLHWVATAYKSRIHDAINLEIRVSQWNIR